MDSKKFSIPAYLSNFSTLDNGRTEAKLKVFYVGETADGRIFDDSFAEKLVESLPYCPVVAFYSDVKDDFIGHNSTQYIYGLVQPDAEYSFEECDDGKKWLITTVMLYTDRIDNIGEIANKIVGQPHSLELDPKTVKYNVFSENGKTKIRFTEGRLAGLSVLSEKQKPAFTGSEFFAATDFSDVRERFENFFSCLEEESRGESMDNFKTLADFIELTYSEKTKLASDSLRTQLGDNFYSYVVEMTDTYFVAHIYDCENESTYFLRIPYTMSDSEMTLQEGVKVVVRYLTQEEASYLEGYNSVNEMEGSEEKEKEQDNCVVQNESSEPAQGDCGLAESNDDEKDDEDDDEESKCVSAEDDKDKDNKCVVDNNDKEVANDDEKNNDCASKEGVEEEKIQSGLSAASALSDSERIELENYRRRDRIELIKSFETLLPEETISSFESKVDEYDYAKLETELAVAHSRYTRQNKPVVNQSIPFSFSSVEKPQGDGAVESYKDLVAKRLKK